MSIRPSIVHVVHSLAIGGLENGLVNLINTSSAEFRHVIVCLTTDGPLRSRLRPGVEVVAIGKRAGHDLPAFLRLIRLLRRLRPAIVHSRNWAAFDAVLAARLAGVPVVVHGEHGRDITDPEGRNVRRNRIRRLLAPLVTRFVPVSGDLARWLVEDVRVPAHRVTPIRNGVDLSRFGHVSRTAARTNLGLPGEAVVVGTVGRLDPVKDQAGLVRAFADVVAAHPESLLVIAGDGACRGDLEGLAAGLGVGERVRLLGERRDIPLVLGAMDIFVLPSVAEGMSNTVLEAMASGLPVVATRVGGNAEMVDDGVTGTLVPPRDAATLSAAISTYIDDPHLRSLHGKASRDRAREEFGLERMCRAYAALYQSLIARRAQRGR